MVKKIVFTSICTLFLFLSGCGNSEGESSMQTQEMLDNGNFDGVIQKLGSSASSDGEYLSLASAYMGRAGFSFPIVTNIASDSADTQNTDAYSLFIKEVKTRTKANSLIDLDYALSNYKKVIGSQCRNTNAILSSAQKDVCLYVGFANLASSAVGVSYLTDNAAALATSSQSDGKLQSTTCALSYALTGSVGSQCTLISQNRITFVESNNSYDSLIIDVNNTQFEELLADATPPTPKSVLLTDGYCTLTSFASRTQTQSSSLHVCPLSTTSNAKEFTSDSLLLTTLNDGIDSISSLGTSSSDDIKKFRDEILVASGRSNDVNKTITASDLVDYFNTKNR